MLVGSTVYDAFTGPVYRRLAIQDQNVEALRSAIEKCRPDVIFCWNLYGLDRSMFDALVATGSAIVTMLTDNWLASMINPERVNAYFAKVVHGRQRLEDLEEGRDQVTTLPAQVSAIFGAEYMRDFYKGSGLLFKKSRVVHNGVDLPPAGLEHPAARHATTSASAFRLLFAGRIVEIKGTHTAIEALGKLRRQRPDVHWQLDIVGETLDAAYLTRLRELAVREQCTNNVHYLGKVDPSALPSLFAERDVYLFPSYYEPFSLTLIHAIASGIPTVASSVGGNFEIVRDGETGLLARRGDSADFTRAILQLHDNVELRSRISRQGAQHARTYSMKAMIDGMEACLQQASEELR
jgi:glycosyltransferase involved in cell wall biosynthesis